MRWVRSAEMTAGDKSSGLRRVGKKGRNDGSLTDMYDFYGTCAYGRRQLTAQLNAENTEITAHDDHNDYAAFADETVSENDRPRHTMLGPGRRPAFRMKRSPPSVRHARIEP
jgi:hypothetical protein